ncbi:unnamed protein product [Calicophoron daubneyi]|uniref:Ig-like domain-containing protein n=1 Tax=Calicophoron daubneyi TaxID=300641 RepID=A0AAV2TJW6_CALDB
MRESLAVIIQRPAGIPPYLIKDSEAKYVEDLLKPCAPHFMGSGLCSFVKATVSDRIELSCAIEGVPTPWFCWIKDYQVLKNTTEGEVQMHREDNVYRLIVENAGLEHAGIWDFVCYNAHGLLTASCQFDITGKERQSDETLADTLTSETGNRTDSIPQTISTNPKGRPKYDPIVPKAIPELSETEKQSTQTKSQKADLEPPEFSSVFTDTTCYAGETVRLKCCITGSPSPSTEWNFNGKPIDNLNNRIGSGCTGNEHWLTIRNACVQDSGRYDITAENIVGIATCSAVLFVCDPQANRPVSPSSEPGFFTAITESSASRLRSHEHPCRTSGTQTPSNQRVSTIRSVSMSSLRGNLEDDPRRRSNPCLEYRCFFRKNGSVDSELVDDGVFIDEGGPNTYKVSRNTAPPVLRRRRAPITRTQRSSSTGTRDRISRVRSEEHLIHHCPVCSTIMMPMHPMQDTAGSCILPNVVYTPISSCDSMLVESICPHCYGAKRYSFSNEVAKHTSVNPNENNLQNSFVSSEKTTNREREIPIKRLGTPSAYKNPAKVHIVQEHSVNETWYHKDQPAVLPTKPTDPESYSVVESSDGDS